MSTVLEGEFEKLLYSNEREDYSVARVRVPNARQPVIVVGNLFGLSPGQQLRVHGQWVEHPRFGRQFKVESFESIVPTTLTGIEKYLGSGMIDGIGPVFASRIVQTLGVETFQILDNNPQLLLRVPGLGPGRIEKIKKAWREHREIRDVMVFLQGHGVGPALAVRIFGKYGSRSIEVVRNRPYNLAMDVYGIGFIKADEIAQKVGIARDAPERMEAGVLHILRELSEDGHVCFPRSELIAKGAVLLGCAEPPVGEALTALTANHRIVIEASRPLVEDPEQPWVYLASLHASETGVARRMTELAAARSPLSGTSKLAAEQITSGLGFTPSPEQAAALNLILESKVSVLTGGPGTGKTTILKALIRLLQRAHIKVALAAPTGRAARRLTEATGYEAKTLHRLLEYGRGASAFLRNRENRLDTQFIVVDEASMVDTVLMYHLLEAAPDPAHVLMVGDVNQLPSVGPGNVLRDLIASGRIPTAELKHIFRQAQSSRIVTNAHRINEGQMPEMETAAGGDLSDFYFIEEDDPQRVLDKIRQLVLERIPKRFGLHPIRDIQVLTPMHRGEIGAESLNARLREWLNPAAAAQGVPGGEFRSGDKVMQIRNNYDKDVYNGDIGRITRVDADDGEVEIRFDNQVVHYSTVEMSEVAPAYAITVHKAQGSEYPAVILPLLSTHYMMLQRNLLYTAVTRARKLLVLIGSKQALAVAVRNNRLQQRCTLLKERLIAGGLLRTP